MAEDWFPWYPALYEADTLHLTVAEDGTYRRLIDWYMTHRRALPDHPVALAKIARLGVDEWNAVAPAVLRFFKRRYAGQLNHARCDLILDRQDKRSGRRSEIAKKGASARYGGTRSHHKNNGLDTSSMLEADNVLNLVDYSVQAIAPPEAVNQPRPSGRKGAQKGGFSRKNSDSENNGLLASSMPTYRVDEIREEKKDGTTAPSKESAPPLAAPDDAPDKRGTRLPKSWNPSAANLAEARAMGMPPPAIGRIADSFRDYWISRPGREGLKLDWDATWRNWCRKECDDKGWVPAVASNGHATAGPDWDARLRYYAGPSGRRWRSEWGNRDEAPVDQRARFDKADNDAAQENLKL
jgi:uncharacterized protein YdaU (DUF1376 family)